MEITTLLIGFVLDLRLWWGLVMQLGIVGIGRIPPKLVARNRNSLRIQPELVRLVPKSHADPIETTRQSVSGGEKGGTVAGGFHGVCSRRHAGSHPKTFAAVAGCRIGGSLRSMRIGPPSCGPFCNPRETPRPEVRMVRVRCSASQGRPVYRHLPRPLPLVPPKAGQKAADRL